MAPAVCSPSVQRWTSTTQLHSFLWNALQRMSFEDFAYLMMALITSLSSAPWFPTGATFLAIERACQGRCLTSNLAGAVSYMQLVSLCPLHCGPQGIDLLFAISGVEGGCQTLSWRHTGMFGDGTIEGSPGSLTTRQSGNAKTSLALDVGIESSLNLCKLATCASTLKAKTFLS
jgi:hypothetical protein